MVRIRTKIILLIFSSILLTACASTGNHSYSKDKDTDQGFVFFQGNPSADCRFIDSAEGQYTGTTKADGLEGAKAIVQKAIINLGGNSARILAYNSAITTYKLSAEAYYCPKLNLLKADTTDAFF